ATPEAQREPRPFGNQRGRGLPRDAYARARVTRSGRRYASVMVEAWQDNRDRLIAQATGHFLMPTRDG
ncbi:MAG: PaaI family thioesterase, partial [Pseudomonadota bacterium]